MIYKILFGSNLTFFLGLAASEIVSIEKIQNVCSNNSAKPTCDPPNLDNYGLAWYGEPLLSPYVYFTAPITQRSWLDASLFCNSMGLGTNTSNSINLARIMNEFENQAVLETIEMFNPNSRKHWIAGNGFENSTLDSFEWRWLQMNFNESLVLPLNYTNWGLDEPHCGRNDLLGPNLGAHNHIFKTFCQTTNLITSFSQ